MISSYSPIPLNKIPLCNNEDMVGYMRIDLLSYLEQQGIDPELQRLIHVLAFSCKHIKDHMTVQSGDKVGSENQSGDEQVALDKQADMIMMTNLRKSGLVHQFASEEQENLSMLNPSAKYSIAIDPLDGSSLVEVNLAVGTIIGIHQGPIVLNGKRNLAGALFVVYGPLTTMIISLGKGVHQFVLNKAGEFMLSKENIQLQEKGKLYMVGGKRPEWSEQHTKFVEAVEQEEYKLRVCGAFVTELSQIILKGGGIFTYPKTKQAPGKLRVLFELEPMAFIIEQAGGLASTGTTNILDITSLDHIHQKVPIYIGSKYEVEKAKQFLGGHNHE